MVEVETPHDSFRKFFAHPLLQGVVLVALAATIALALQQPDHFPDPDSFYHAAMAELAASGQFPTTFPWLDLTTLRHTYADLHFVYHLILVPFVAAFGPMAGIRIATILAVALFTAAFFTLLRALRVRGAFIFTLLLIGSAAFMFRANLAKSQGFAFFVLFLGLIALMRRNRAGVFLAALFAAWMSSHWPVFLIAVGIYAIAHVAATLLGSPSAVRALWLSVRESASVVIYALLGIAAGFIVNPYFPANMTVARQQIVDVALVGTTHGAAIGIEWAPLALKDFLGAIGFLLPLVVAAAIGGIVLLLRLIRDEEVCDRDAVAASATFAILALAFAFLTLRSQRHIEFFIPLIILFIAVSLQPIIDWLWPPRVVVGWRRPGVIRRSLSTLLLGVALTGFAIGSVRGLNATRQSYAQGFSSRHLRGAAAWLSEHTPVGTMVFHGEWHDFPFLFLHNRNQRYLVGLDPRFAVLDDEKRFAAWNAISRTTNPADTTVASRIIEVFHARFAFVSTEKSDLLAALNADPQATNVYHDDEGNIFELMP